MQNITLLNFLNSFLGSVSDESLKLFESITTYRKLKKGDIVVEYARPTSKFYILEDGIVGSFLTDKKGKECIRILYKKGNAFGSLSSFIREGSNSNASYKCLKDCNVYEGNFDEFKNLRSKSSDFKLLYRKFIEASYLRAEKKIDELSLLNASERYTKLMEEIPDLNNILPQYLIAGYLNITAVQLSRIRKKLFNS